MNQRFKVVSLTQQQAPLAIRELLALDEPACRTLLTTLRDQPGLTDVLVLSTCNRTEVYYSAVQDRSAVIIGELARLKNVADSTRIALYFVSITSTRVAVQHLFEVAMGLDAQVIHCCPGLAGFQVTRAKSQEHNCASTSGSGAASRVPAPECSWA